MRRLRVVSSCWHRAPYIVRRLLSFQVGTVCLYMAHGASRKKPASTRRIARALLSDLFVYRVGAIGSVAPRYTPMSAYFFQYAYPMHNAFFCKKAAKEVKKPSVLFCKEHRAFCCIGHAFCLERSRRHDFVLEP